MAGDAGAKPIQNRGYRIEQQPFALVAEHTDLVKDRSKEDSERQHYFDNEFHIAEEEASGGYNHSDSSGKDHHREKQHRSPEEIGAPTDPDNHQKYHQGSGRHAEIEEADPAAAMGKISVGK